MTNESVGDVQECRHSYRICQLLISGSISNIHTYYKRRPFDRKEGDDRLLSWDVSEGVVLNAREDHGQKNCDAHGDGAEYTHARQLVKGPGKRYKETHKSSDNLRKIDFSVIRPRKT